MNKRQRPRRGSTDRLFLTFALAIGVVSWQHWVHLRTGLIRDAGFFGELPHLVRDVLLAMPVGFVAVQMGERFSSLIARIHGPSARGPRPILQAAVSSQIFLVLMLGAIPIHGKIDELFGGEAADGGIPMITHAITDGLKSQFAAFPALLLALLVLNCNFKRYLLPISKRRTLVRVLAAAILIPSLVVAPNTLDPSRDVALAQGTPGDPCDAGAPLRTYDVSAIDVQITLNRFGDNDPNGKMFVLDNRIGDVRAEEATGEVTPGLRQDAIQPLAIRANAGECLVVNFTNRLAAGDASFQVKGLPYLASSGAGNVGVNPNTLAAPDQTMTYRFPVPTGPTAEGSLQINSGADTRQTLAHGLFGMLMIEPAGSTYMDPEVPGKTIESGWEAIIVDPNGPNFREFVIMMHEVGDEVSDVFDSNGDPLPVVEALTDTYRPSSRALNYRSEPFSNRLELNSPVTGEKSLGYSSYAYGDPATPIPRSYLGEPSKTRIGHPGSEMFHIYHLHGGGDRWRRNPQVEPDAFTGGLDKTPQVNSQSTRMDSQSVGPGETYNLEHECGAGGCQQAAGDFLFHCHIGQHYVAGMWSFWRVFDTIQPDLAEIPSDATTVPVAQSGTSLDLLSTVVEGKMLVAADDLSDPNTQMALEEWVENQLPPQGVPLDGEDATVWDWTWEYVGGDLSQPLARGEPETTAVWPNYQSENPGQRPDIRFNLNNGRYTWPLFKPHLNQRPPFSGNGHTGAPWLGENGSATRPDALCPSTATRTLDYPVSAIDLPIEVSPGLVDPNGMLFALNEDIDDIRSGTQKAEPIVLRSNVGDCERLIITSEQEDANHGGHAKVNIHSHFTQFDPQASDGVVTGFSYEQSIRPYSTEDRILDDPADVGDIEIDVTNVNRLREGIWIGIGLGEGMCDASGQQVANPNNTHRPCTEIRKIESIDVGNNRITLNQALINSHPAGEAVGVEFVQSLWYSDVDSGTVFFHDHVDFTNWKHGLFGAHIIEPAGSTWHDPNTGEEIRTGTIADIRAPANSIVGWDRPGSFREMLVMLSDTNAAVDVNGVGGGGGDGLAAINLRSAPLNTRDPNFPFSSVTNGDPGSVDGDQGNVLRAYVGDNVVLRGLSVVEREDSLRVTGHRFRMEQRDGNSQLIDAINLGTSEREDLALEAGAGGPNGYAGDYLIHSGIKRNLEGGAWGIMRVHDRSQNDLQELPNNTGQSPGNGFPQQTFTGLPPASVVTPPNPCPVNAPERAYDISLIQINTAEDNDWGGYLYALDSDVAGLRAGSIEPEPLVIRVAKGECLRVNFTNLENEIAGFHVGKMVMDPQGGHGVAIGYNLDSSVDRDGTRTYRFYADEETGTSMILDLASPRSLSEGAYGAVIVEPEGATWRDPVTGDEIFSGTRADVIAPNGQSFREQVMLIQETDDRIGSDTMPYFRQVRDWAGINYGRDEFENEQGTGRLQVNPDPSLVYDTATHGDPNLLLEAYTGDPVRLRVGVATAEGSHVFNIDGHRFPWDVGIADSEQLNHRGLLPGESFDARLTDGAGAGVDESTDYLMGDSRMPFHEAGVWGILRTHDSPQANLLPLFENCNGRAITVDLNLGETPTDGDDVILGTPNADLINAGEGNDVICGMGGGDTINGGDGNDIVFGDDGDDQISGGDGDDQLIGGLGVDTINGDEGADYLNGGTGNDIMNGGDNPDGTIDILEGGPGNDTLDGGRGNDVVNGQDGNDTLRGGEDDDYLLGGLGVDDFDGGLGQDYLEGGAEGEIMDGGAGDDIIIGHAGDDILIGGPDNGDGIDYLLGGLGVDTYHGGDGDDYLQGGAEGETMNGGAGDDIIIGAGGDDTLNGGEDTDYLLGGPGVDTYNGDDGDDWLDGGAEGETMNGGAGDDIIIGAGGDDTLNGGEDTDYLLGGPGVDTYNGDDGDDWLDGGAEGETMNGGAGDDIIIGAGGDDTLIGGPALGDGADYLNGGSGVDTFEGGDGNDWLDGDGEGETMNGGAGDDQIYGMGGDDVLNGDAGADYLNGGSGVDTFDGGADNDWLDGDGEGETMNGGAGDDQIYGLGGDDTLVGGGGDNDYLSGGAGDDDLDGGLGTNDHCDGGIGANTFSNCEVILP